MSIKHEHPEFPSDIYIVFEALNVQVVINESMNDSKTVSMAEYLKTPMTKKVVTAFILPPYAREKYYFGSYKVS